MWERVAFTVVLVVYLALMALIVGGLLFLAACDRPLTVARSWRCRMGLHCWERVGEFDWDDNFYAYEECRHCEAVREL